MNPIIEALAGLLLIMLLTIFMLGVSKLEEILRGDIKRKEDNQSAGKGKMLRKQTDKETSDDIRTTNNNSKT